MKYKFLIIALVLIIAILSINFMLKADIQTAPNFLSNDASSAYQNAVTTENAMKLTQVNDTPIIDSLIEAKSTKVSFEGTKIKVALLLDTSNSMDGLIEQAKSQIWQIINHLARAENSNGEETELQIALYEYGNPSKVRSQNQINLLSPFTTDMDFISEKLFSLSTNGGEEYCGEMILTSLEDLNWGENSNDMKMIYIAGNEPFSQGPVSYEEACKRAINNGVVVNTIFCGNWQAGVKTFWKQGAQIGEGEYMNIDHNASTSYIETPYDDDINELNLKLNKTYMPYGRHGKSKFENQHLQDSNANSYSKSNAAERALFKSSKKYKADEWDLVDAYKKDKNILKHKSITDNLQEITVEELEAKIEAASAERASIQEKIRDINMKRESYIQDQSKDKEEDKSLKNSIVKSIEKSAKKKGLIIK